MLDLSRALFQASPALVLAAGGAVRLQVKVEVSSVNLKLDGPDLGSPVPARITATLTLMVRRVSGPGPGDLRRARSAMWLRRAGGAGDRGGRKP